MTTCAPGLNSRARCARLAPASKLLASCDWLCGRTWLHSVSKTTTCVQDGVSSPRLVFEDAERIGGHQLAIPDRSSHNVRDLSRAAIPV